MNLSVVKTEKQEINEAVVRSLEEAIVYAKEHGSVGLSLCLFNPDDSSHTITSRSLSRKDLIVGLLDQLMLVQQED